MSSNFIETGHAFDIQGSVNFHQNPAMRPIRFMIYEYEHPSFRPSANEFGSSESAPRRVDILAHQNRARRSPELSLEDLNLQISLKRQAENDELSNRFDPSSDLATAP